jgi:hypothetical protein
MEKINQSNLLQGKTSEGGNMPPYSRKYRMGRVFYRNYKMRSNPLNRGRWDLKHWWAKKYDGLFYKSIKVTVTLKEVVFTTNYKPDYMKDIYHHISKGRILGITKKQFIQVQIENKNRVKPKLLDIINKGA